MLDNLRSNQLQIYSIETITYFLQPNPRENALTFVASYTDDSTDEEDDFSPRDKHQVR